MAPPEMLAGLRRVLDRTLIAALEETLNELLNPKP